MLEVSDAGSSRTGPQQTLSARQEGGSKPFAARSVRFPGLRTTECPRPSVEPARACPKRVIRSARSRPRRRTALDVFHRDGQGELDEGVRVLGRNGSVQRSEGVADRSPRPPSRRLLPAEAARARRGFGTSSGARCSRGPPLFIGRILIPGRARSRYRLATRTTTWGTRATSLESPGTRTIIQR